MELQYCWAWNQSVCGLDMGNLTDLGGLRWMVLNRIPKVLACPTRMYGLQTNTRR